MISFEPFELASLQGGKKFRGPGSRAKNDELAGGRKEVMDLVETTRRQMDASWKHTKDWRVKAEESYEFVENEQWDQKDRAYLEEQRRPVMTFNEILPIVRLLSGLERQNRQTMMVFPREGGDVDGARVLTELVRYVDDLNLGTWDRVRKSNDVYVVGRGYIKTDISYEKNVTGDPTFGRIHPLSVFNDVDSDDWAGRDRKFVIHATWATEEEAKGLWPEFAEQIKVGDWLSDRQGGMPGNLTGDKLFNDSLFLDRVGRRVRILEKWYKERMTAVLAVHMGTGDVRVATPRFFEALRSLPANERERIQIIRQPVTMVRVATIINWLLVQDKPSPFEHGDFPICQYIGIQYNKEPLGIVEYIKDPQRLKNKSYSQGMNHLNRSANSGWMNHGTQGADPDILQKFGSVPGVVITHKGAEPRLIRPAPLSMGHFTMMKDASEQVKRTTLINAELQGLTTQATVSGKAIEARQRGGLTGNEDFFDNQLLGDKILGAQLIGNIQQTFTPERARRVVDNLAARFEDSVAARLIREKKQQLPGMIERALREEYDYIVDQAAASVTERERMFDRLMEVAEKFPGNVPPDVLIEASDFPDSIKARMKEYMQELQARSAAESGTVIQ